VISLDIFSALMAGSLFALACNLDTVLAAVGQGARGIPLGPRELFTAAGVTTAVTFLSLELGALGASFLPAGLAEKLGGLALAGLGLWYLLDALRGKNDPPQEATRGWLALSAALAVNNAGVGVAAGVTGLSPLVASGCNFAMTLLSLWLGRLLGRRLNRWSRLALPLSGLLLVGLGAWQLI
jgi:putative Mn2+ efflux pump MntP